MSSFKHLENVFFWKPCIFHACLQTLWMFLDYGFPIRQKKTQKVLGCCEPNLKTYVCFLPFYLQNLFFERKLIVYINFFRFCTLDNWTEKRYWNDDLFEFVVCWSMCKRETFQGNACVTLIGGILYLIDLSTYHNLQVYE